MIFDLAQASRVVDALLREFGQGQAPFMVQHTLWDHRHGDDHPTVSIYVGLALAFRREAATLAGALTQVRAELVARFGERPA
jgi:hypothetical protein